ncbi:MAG: hypothetical protein H6814_11480 [Phycisphaeraceae bacterium]|nr:hypothetical protein [Phycisphaeraceae bacterium]
MTTLLTLWDLLTPSPRPRRRPPVVAPARPRPAKPKPRAAQVRYDEITRAMLREHGIRVRKWRTSMSGCAWEVHYESGKVSRLIEAPRPKGPMSMAVFLHEVGHHAIGLGAYKPRCLEEYHAWAWSLTTMESLGLNVTDRVRQRMHDSLRYAVHKSRSRGIRSLPSELAAFDIPYPKR